MAVPVYRGRFGKPQAERLLWRAGFGPRKGEAEKLAKLGLEGAVHKLTNPGRERFHGPRPHDDNGHRLAPNDAWGHDQLWWLDRMVRTNRPLAERMTLGWHDWVATSRDRVGPARFRYDPQPHDTGVKPICGKRGRFDWQDSCRLCVHPRVHPSFFVMKLWSYFIPTPPPAGTKRALQRLYVEHGHQVKPVVAA